MSRWACLFVAFYIKRLRRVALHRRATRACYLAQHEAHHRMHNGDQAALADWHYACMVERRLKQGRPAGYFRDMEESLTTETAHDDGHWVDWEAKICLPGGI